MRNECQVMMDGGNGDSVEGFVDVANDMPQNLRSYGQLIYSIASF